MLTKSTFYFGVSTEVSAWVIIHKILALGVFPIIWICPLRLLNCFTATIFLFSPAAWSIFPDKGSNLRHLHWKVVLIIGPLGKSFMRKYLKKGETGLLIWEGKKILENICLCSKVPGFSAKSVSRQCWFFTHAVNKVGL